MIERMIYNDILVFCRIASKWKSIIYPKSKKFKPVYTSYIFVGQFPGGAFFSIFLISFLN